MTDAISTPILPAHIEDTVKAIARLHAEHYENATPLQRLVDRSIARVGRPESVGLLAVLVVGWMALNVGMRVLGHAPLDEPPFFWLQGAVALAALFTTVLILTTQRHEDKLATHREQLTLELAILSEQKAAKIIELLEELRRDMPQVPNRIDPDAETMAKPADPQAVLDAIRDTHEDMLAIGKEPVGDAAP